MAELIKCKLCGELPEVKKSYSRRMIHHICHEVRIGWSSIQNVTKQWNDRNSPKAESTEKSHNSVSRQFPTFEKFNEWYHNKNNAHEASDYFYFFTGNWPA